MKNFTVIVAGFWTKVCTWSRSECDILLLSLQFEELAVSYEPEAYILRCMETTSTVTKNFSSNKYHYCHHNVCFSFSAWQKECLNLVALQQKKNLVYALPTGGGKTLVAEMLILRELICCRKNAIFVVPYVAIVQEKVTTTTAVKWIYLDKWF
jgi:replicative superfamily II helicase